MQSFELLHGAMLLVFQVSIVLLCSLIAEKFSQKIMVPRVVGYILIGLIIGPCMLGSLPLGSLFPHGIFPSTAETSLGISQSLYNLASIASVILLFYSGLETDVNLFLKYAFKGSIIGIGGLVFSFLGGYGVSVLFFPALSALHPAHLFMGTIATATSVGISTSVLSSKQKVSSPEGVTILSAAVFDDVLGIVILAVVMGIVDAGGHTASAEISLGSVVLIFLKSLGLWLGSTALGLLFAKKLGHSLKKAITSTTRISICVLAIAFLVGAFFEAWGLSMIVGAYIVGLALSNTDLSYVIQEKLSPILLLFVPMFFVISGMQINIVNFARPEVLILGAAYSLVCMASKFFGTALPSLWLGFNALGASRIGMGMAPRGEVALIIASIGLAAGAMGSTLYNAIMLMIISNALIAPLFLQMLLGVSRDGTKKSEKSHAEKTEINFDHWQLTRFIVSDFLTLMEEEGFFVNKIAQREKNIYHIRKDSVFFTLHSFNAGKLVFFSDKQSIPFFKTALYEATADIAESAQAVKEKVSYIASSALESETSTGNVSKTQSLENVISPFLVELSIRANTKEEIITELVGFLDKGGYLENKSLFLKDIFEREKTFSTGMQNGIAIPHARSNACKSAKIVIGLKPEGADFDSLDTMPSRIFVLIATPKEYPHLGLLTQISTLLQHEAFRETLLACTKETEVVELFNSGTSAEQAPTTKAKSA